ARLQGIGGKPEPALTEPMDAIFQRLEDAFAQTLPLTGRRGNRPEITLLTWTADTSETVNDPQLAAALARQLRRAWIAANGREKPPGHGNGEQPQLTPEDEEELKALGYVAGGK